MASIRTNKRYPTGEPEWLRTAGAYHRFMHYAPVELFMVGGSLIGGAIGLGLFLLWRAF